MRPHCELVLGLLFLLSTICVASAACDGGACYRGVLRDCVRLPSGDTVWVNHNPYTRCQEQVPHLGNGARPPIKFNPAPKHTAVVPPSPYISPNERSAHPAQCEALRRASIERERVIFQAHCSSRTGDPNLDAKTDALVRERQAIIRKCPQFGPMEDDSKWPTPPISGC
jgi:hypothetical protein